MVKNLEEILTKSTHEFISFTKAKSVSSDFIKDTNFLVYDLSFSQTHGKFVKISAWQDNEYGYANQLLQTIKATS